MIKFKFDWKHCNRLVVMLLALAPVVYLFGGLFAGLVGSHGQVVYAGSSRLDYVDVNTDVLSTDDLRLVWNEQPSGTGSWYTDLMLESNGVTYDRIRWVVADSQLEYRPYGSGTFIPVYRLSDGWLSAGWQYATFSGSAWQAVSYTNKNYMLSMGTLQRLELVNDPISNSDYVFSQFFASNNFVRKIGDNALSESPIGFVPFSAFIKYVDANMLHFASGNVGAGVMAYGYFYWVAHVLLLDLVFYVSVFFIRIMKRVLNRLEGGAQ